MSGSGGDFGGGLGAAEHLACESLVIRTTLSSPKPDVVKTLKVSDVLAVVKMSPTGPVSLQTPKGSVAGSITSGLLLRLMKCIDDGFEYVAVVRSIDRGRIDVEIRPKVRG